jgi:hypothetical protein
MTCREKVGVTSLTKTKWHLAALALAGTLTSDVHAGPYSLTTINAKPGRCILEVNGTRLISGACRVDLERDGSFSIYDVADPGYFAMVFRDGPKAIGYWNGARGSHHAQDPLGTLTRKGAYWQNRRARVCAWAN